LLVSYRFSKKFCPLANAKKGYENFLDPESLVSFNCYRLNRGAGVDRSLEKLANGEVSFELSEELANREVSYAVSEKLTNREISCEPLRN